MKIWITRYRDGDLHDSWTSKPHLCGDGHWRSTGGVGAGTGPETAKRLIGDQYPPDGPFCFQVEIGEVERVRTREDVAKGLRTMLDHNSVGSEEFGVLCEAIALIENPDSSNRE